MSEPTTLEVAIGRVLQRRWIDRGFGKFNCASCGAQRSVDYGDHEQPTTEKREPCSRTCPWRIVEEHLAQITAAPEVLAALEEYHNSAAVSRVNAGEVGVLEAWDLAEAAIAKAEGR